MMGVTPNFLIVGTMKSGTTTLRDYLAEHPEIFIPETELHFFNHTEDYNKGIEWYSQYFSDVKNEIAIGEKTPSYSNHVRRHYVPERIKNTFPDMKLIWIFRNPVKRTYSHYWHGVRNGVEKLNFNDALLNQESRLESRSASAFLYRSLYAEQIELYLKFFKREQMVFLLFEELAKNHNKICKTIYEFLGVNQNFEIQEEKRSNEGVIGLKENINPSFLGKIGEKVISKEVKKLKAQIPEMDNESYLKLQDYFYKPNKDFQELTGLNIDAWSEN